MARGSVVKRGNRWYVRYDAGPDPATGERRQRGGGGYPTEREAEAALARCLARVVDGAHVDQTRQTVAAYCRYWLGVAIPGTKRDTTVENYRHQIEDHIIPALGAHRLAALRAGHINRTLRAWEAAGMAPSMRRLLYSRLRQIVRHALAERVLVMDPMAGVPRPGDDPAEQSVWAPAELDRFLAAIADEPEYPMWRLYAMTGLRRAEAMGLRWRDVEWEKGRIRVEQQIVDVGGERKPAPPKSARSRRIIDLDEGTLAALRTQRGRHVGSELVFPARDGGPLHPSTVGYRWRQVVRRSGMPYLSLHGLRHMHASHLVAEDGNIPMIAERLGHDPAILLRTYAHVRPDAQRRGLGRLLAAMAQREQGSAIGEER